VEFNNLKEGQKEKKVMEHHQTINRSTMAPQVGGQLFGVHLPVFNVKFKNNTKSSKFPISINFTYLLRKK